MTWNDPGKPNNPDIDIEDEIQKENPFSGWQRNKKLGLFADLISSPFVWGGTAVIIFIIMLMIFWPDSDSRESSEKMDTLTQRLDFLENRISTLENNLQNVTGLEPQEQNMESFQNRIEQLEAFVKHRTDQFTSELQKTQKKVADLESRPVAAAVTRKPGSASKPATAAKPSAPEKTNTGRYHTVKEGETLYRISINNGISVDKLLELNNLPKNTIIRPGQKLRVSP